MIGKICPFRSGERETLLLPGGKGKVPGEAEAVCIGERCAAWNIVFGCCHLIFGDSLHYKEYYK